MYTETGVRHDEIALAAHVPPVEQTVLILDILSTGAERPTHDVVVFNGHMTNADPRFEVIQQIMDAYN